jgi:hypothetical protein
MTKAELAYLVERCLIIATPGYDFLIAESIRTSVR